MMGKANITLDNDCLLVSGEINFVTAASLWNDSLPLLAQCKKLSFDFSRVTQTNSAALALLIEWMKYAKQERKPISFQHLSSQLLGIAMVGGVDKLINSSF